MSIRSITRHGSKLCWRSDSVCRSLPGAAIGVESSLVIVSSATRSTVPIFRNKSTRSSQIFRVEGVQGPFSTNSLSLHDSKLLLAKAAKLAASGHSPQGVQESHLHTDSIARGYSSKASAKFDWDLDDTASPQGVQGDLELIEGSGCAHFQTWLDNCRRYGLTNCDQQLQGIQTGRVTLAQVLAEQEAMIAEIAESYRRRAQERPSQYDESMQGAQGDARLPEVGAPCPQGVQGDDCVRFKLWLENCHRFGLHECVEQLQGFQSGRVTLAQIFLQQEAAIKQVVHQYQQRRSYSTQPRPAVDPSKDDSPDSRFASSSSTAAASSSAQVGEGQKGQGQGQEQLSQREKLKRAVKEYGSTVVIFHITISLASLGGFYLAVSSGIDMVSLLKSLGLGESTLQAKLAAGTGTFVVAYAVHKVFAPVRIAATLTATPLIVRYLRRIGFLKAPKTTAAASSSPSSSSPSSSKTPPPKTVP